MSGSNLVWDDYTDRVRDAADFLVMIETVVGALPRRPRGGRPIMVKCPRHAEKNPSLAIYDDHCHCYGCGWHADCFTLSMEGRGIDFVTARDELARQYGIPRPRWTTEQEQTATSRQHCWDALARAACGFAERLWQVPRAIDYVRGRVWSDEVIRAERIGYADGSPLPDLGDETANSVVRALNLWAESIGGAIVYAHRWAGRVAYFAGRSIDGKAHYNPPRDLAGPKPPYYNARYSRRSSEFAIVEGQGCAITLAGWNVPAVALAGSGLTADLADRIRRHTERGATAYVVPDSDGRTDVAALASAVSPLLRVVTLPDSVADVNAWAQQGAAREDFERLQNLAPTWLDLRITEAVQAHGAARDDLVAELFPLLARLSPISLARYRDRVIKAVRELGARGFDRLLSAARQEATEPARVTVLEGQPVVVPALDFIDGLAVVTVPVLALTNGKPGYVPYLVTSDRKMLQVDNSQIVEVGGKRVVLRERPAVIGSAARWAYADIQSYLAGDCPGPKQVYLAVRQLLDAYIDFRETGTVDILAVWLMGTYLYPLFEAYPYIVLQGPKNSGKTKTLDMVVKLGFNARVSSSMSAASLFRIVQATRGVLGIDEAERLSNARDPVAMDLRLLLNAGYRRGAPAIRCEGEGHQITDFEVYGPKVVASIHGVDDVLESRCIRIVMLRTAGLKGNRLVSESAEDWGKVRHGLYCFALQHFSEVRACYQAGIGIDSLNNRQAEVWRPILAIAAFLDNQGADGLLTLVRDYAGRHAAEAEDRSLDDQRTALVLALFRLASSGRTRITPKEILETMRGFMDVDEHTATNAQWVGYRMREFGFERVEKGGSRGSVYAVSEAAAMDILIRYGIDIPADGHRNETS